jgi:hypothetical protein
LADSSAGFPQSNPGLGKVGVSPAAYDDTASESYRQPQSTSGNPYSSPVYSSPHQARQNYARDPHRGGLILTLGILSIVCNVCLIPGILALALGWPDLKKMDSGQMDREGHGMTLAGVIMGAIMTAMALLVVVFYLFIGVIVAFA